MSGAPTRGLIRRWKVEAGVAALLGALALTVIADALRVGAGWAADGPEPGFFPFYVGLILLVSAAATLIGAVRGRAIEEEAFVARDAAGSVLAVLVPAILFVTATAWIGIYVAAAILIAGFMRWRGGFRLPASVGLGIAVALVVFLTFELWFLTPLPKGPLEAALGL